MNLNGWYAGYVAASVVIVAVVALVGWLLALARRISTQVNEIVDTIGDIRATTAPIPQVAQLNDTLTAVANHAVAARTALTGQE